MILAYAPVATDVVLETHESRLREAFTVVEGKSCNVVLYGDERQLLYDTIEMLRTNSFLVNLYQLDDSRDAIRFACVLLGYNCWEYNYTFLYYLLYFYDLHEHVIAVQSLWREPRFCASQISFYLMKHVAARYHAQVGSVALSNVSRYFGASDRSEMSLSERARRLKMDFDSVSIRRLYYRIDGDDANSGDVAVDDRRRRANVRKRLQYSRCCS